MRLQSQDQCMKPTKSPKVSRKNRPKSNAVLPQAILNKDSYEGEIGMMKTVRLLQQDVQRLARINQISKQQIEELQGDNMTLFSSLKEVKMQQQRMVNAHIVELDRLNMHNQELTRIIRMLEEEMHVKDEERRQVVIINEDLAVQIRQIDEVKCDNLTLKSQIERYKIKLLQSEKYWLTRTQTLLSNKQAEKQRRLLQVQSNQNHQTKILQDQIQLKDKIIDQKTQEIHKLINYIQTALK